MQALNFETNGIICPFCRAAVEYKLISYHYHESRRPNGEACQYDARRCAMPDLHLPDVLDPRTELRQRLTLAIDADGDLWLVVEKEGEGEYGGGNGYFEGDWPIPTTSAEVIRLMVEEEQRIEKAVRSAQQHLGLARSRTEKARAFFAPKETTA